jgi:N-hydroxyarylamine O-acetyltransferase
MIAPVPLDADLRDEYLARLGWREPPEPSVDSLFALHRAHVERVPYETVWIALGQRRELDPLSSMRYLTRGDGGGYCYHLNGAFSLLLEWLGFDVHRHLGGVEPRPSPTQPRPQPGANGNHLAITVTGLPHESSPDGGWLVDVGLGDGLYEPLPLVAGEHPQSPFRYRLRPSVANPGGWRFDHDPALSFVGFDLRAGPVRPDEFAERHEFLMTSPDSGFVRVTTVQRRDAGGVDTLRARTLQRLGGDDAGVRELASQAEWRDALADVFGITLAGVHATHVDAMWDRVCHQHEEYHAAHVG